MTAPARWAMRLVCQPIGLDHHGLTVAPDHTTAIDRAKRVLHSYLKAEAPYRATELLKASMVAVRRLQPGEVQP